jgi:sulfate/thiosulfate-binding protein
VSYIRDGHPGRRLLRSRALDTFAVGVMAIAITLVVVRNLGAADRGAGLLNVSYDPTRELYRDVNAAFSARREPTDGRPLVVKQSHGGSSRQSRAIIDGAPADVATLALYTDIDALRARGLVADGWSERLPNHSVPYTSTIVFVVRKGNPRLIHEFADLVEGDVSVVTPSPKTSGNGKLAFLAAWGSVLHRGGTPEEARAFVAKLYRHVVSLESGAREASTHFVYDKVGDVLLTWENEALLEVAETKDELEVVYPSASIRAEPCVAWVDANVRRHGTEALARSYLEFLFTEPAQEIIAAHHYRPISSAALDRHRAEFPPMVLFPITVLAADWSEAQRTFFDDNGVFDAIVPGRL